MLKKHPYFAIAITGLLLLSALHAQTIAYDVTRQPGNQNWPGNLGLDFDVTSPIIILQLGAFDNNGDGFSGSVQVAIFNRDTLSQVTPSVTFTGTSGTLVNGNRFLTLSPAVTLPVGHYSVVAVGFNNTDLNGNASNAGNSDTFIGSTENTGDGTILFVGTARYDANTTLAFPGIVDSGPENRYLAATFQFTHAALLAPILTTSFVTSFGSGSSTIGDIVPLTFTLRNPNAVPLTGLSFTDTLPDELVVTIPNGLNGSCGDGTITAVASSNSIRLTNGSIPGGGSCSFGANVVVAGSGVVQNNTTSVTSKEAPTGATASASLFIYNWWWLFVS
jgi:uncharacterized repeat protein (TIGR01451 family)